MKIEGLPVIDVEESEKITVAMRAEDLRRQGDVDDARVTKNETLVRRGSTLDAPFRTLATVRAFYLARLIENGSRYQSREFLAASTGHRDACSSVKHSESGSDCALRHVKFNRNSQYT